MCEQKNGIDETAALQNRFTAYLIKALRNRKLNYLREKTRLCEYESSLDVQEYFDSMLVCEDPILGLSVIEQLECCRLQQALKKLRPCELRIVLAKILQDKTFAGIAGELKMKPKTVSSIYYRIIQRIRTEVREGSGK